MILRNFFMLLAITNCFSLFGQTYYEAIKIAKYENAFIDPNFGKFNFAVTKENLSELETILKDYGLQSGYQNEAQLVDSIKKIFTDSNNPFMIATGDGQDADQFDATSITDNLSIKSLPGDIAGLDVTNITRGISLFMINRAKQELTVSFFNRLKNYFEKNPEIKVLFPKSTVALENLLSYHYTEMLPTLRINFHEDLKQLHRHLDDVFQLPKYQELLEQFPEVRIIIKTIRLIGKIQDEKMHAAEIIKRFATFPEWAEKPNARGYQNFRNTLLVASILSESLRYIDSPAQKLNSVDTTVMIYKGHVTIHGTTYETYSKDSTIVYYRKTNDDGKSSTYYFDEEISPFMFWDATKKKLIDPTTIKDCRGLSGVNIDSKMKLNEKVLSLISIKSKKTVVVTKSIGAEVTTTKEIQFSEEKLNPFFSSKSTTISPLENQSTKGWVSPAQLLQLVEDPKAFKVYLGLIYQKFVINQVKFIKQDRSIVSVSGLMSSGATTAFRFQNYVTEFIEIAEELESSIEKLKSLKEAAETLSKEDVNKYISATVNIVDYGFEASRLFDINDLQVDKLIELARNANDLYKNIYEEKYATAVSNGISIFEGITELSLQTDNVKNRLSELIGKLEKIQTYDPKELKSKLKDYKDSPKSKKKLRALVKQLQIDLQEIELLTGLSADELKNVKLIKKVTRLVTSQEFDNTIKFIRKYGVFIANVVEAENAEEVEAVIENAVLPVGSASIKKSSKFNISVQSFLGAAVNTGEDKGLNRAWDNSVSVTAPIGVSFNHGIHFKSQKQNFGSIGVFVSLFDLGAIVDYELKADTTVTTATNNIDTVTSTTTTTQITEKSDYKIELGQIFSPGIYATYGLPFNLPIAASFGIQYGPGLIKIKDGNPNLGKPSWRCVATFTVDIPLFTLANNERKQYKIKN